MKKVEFVDFVKAIQDNFKEMTKDVKYLFEANIDKDVFWDLYLDSFPEGTNEIYRTNREYDCSCCRHFIKNIGNVVVIKNGVIHTIWDVNINDDTFQIVADALRNYLLDKVVIADVWLTSENRIGHPIDHERLDSGEIITYNHFYIDVPKEFRMDSYSINSKKGELRDTRNVFKRSLDEITEESINTVLELIAQNSLYKGNEWEKVLKQFLAYKREYSALTTDREKELWTWEKSIEAGMSIGRIRNHSMGTLLVNISEGMPLDTAVAKYEQIVAPENYKRSKPVFTKKMLEDAQKKIVELGYLDSLKRRYATLDDITVNNILFSNKDAAKRIAGALDLFAEMERDVKSNPNKFSKVEEVSIDDFISNVLPIAKELEVYFENKHVSNMVSLIAPEVSDSKSMFKWNNNFSWAYTGNMTDSSLKENVKAAGGKVDGDLRFSIQWNDTSEYDGNDLDAHCKEPAGGTHIYFGSNARKPGRSPFGGQLDIDITDPRKDVPAVENITWPDRTKMKPGVYKFYVNCWSFRGGRSGFRAEIEFDGQIYSFDYTNALRGGENVQVAEVTLDNSGKFSIKTLIPSTSASKEVWGLHTNEFVPVTTMMMSPNYWDDQNGIGNKHYFFMLKDCVNPEEPNSFYNEFLCNELYEHRKVMEALGAKAHVNFVEDQLSGVGFSSTKRSELIVKIKGETERLIKIKF